MQTLEHPATDTNTDPYKDEIVDYYSEAGPDYEAWSPQYNMHFGYYARPMNPLKLEPMLVRMNAEVFRRLPGGRFDAEHAARLLDAGCGLGTPARYAATQCFPQAHITGATLVPWQIKEARRRTNAAGLTDRVEFLRADYTALPHGDASFDAAYAIESACYAPGLDKGALLAELQRVLKPGGRIAIADGFWKRGRPQRGYLSRLERRICECWSFDTFADLNKFVETLADLGFTDIRCEDISWNIAPSVLHVPFVTARFLFDELILRRTRLNRQRRKNLIAPALAPILGLHMRRFGYFIVTATKPA